MREGVKAGHFILILLTLCRAAVNSAFGMESLPVHLCYGIGAGTIVRGGLA